MQEQEITYLLTDTRKETWRGKHYAQFFLLIAELRDRFVIQKDEGKHKYDEIAIPEKLRCWPPTLGNFRGTPLPGPRYVRPVQYRASQCFSQATSDRPLLPGRHTQAAWGSERISARTRHWRVEGSPGIT